MPITEFARNRRKNNLGSSDTPPLLGCDPWRTSADVFISKVVEDPTEIEEVSPAAALGNILENAIIDHAAEILQMPLKRNQYRVGANKIHAANLDAIARDVPEIVEIKTSGLRGRVPEAEADQWGEEGSGEVPFRVAAQVQHQLYCAGPDYRRAHVVAWVGFRGIVPFVVERHDELIEIILNKGEAFWRNHVVPKIPPTEEPPRLDWLKKVAREKGKIACWTEQQEEMVHAWLDACRFSSIQTKVATAAKERKDYWDAKILWALGDAEGADLWNGNEIQIKTENRKGYTVEPFRVVKLKFGEKKDG